MPCSPRMCWCSRSSAMRCPQGMKRLRISMLTRTHSQLIHGSRPPLLRDSFQNLASSSAMISAGGWIGRA